MDPQDPRTEPTIKPSWLRRWSKRALVLTLILIGAFFLASIDSAAPDDSEFQFKTSQSGPPAQPLLAKGIAALGNNKYEFSDLVDSSPKTDDATWDTEALEAHLENSAAGLAAFEAAATGHFEFEDTSMDSMGLYSSIYPLLDLVDLRRLQRLKQDRLKEAMSDALLIARLGAKIRDAGGSRNIASIGQQFLSRALMRIREMLWKRPGFQTACLRKAAQELLDYRDHQGLVDSLRADYRLNRLLVDDYAAGRKIEKLAKISSWLRVSFFRSYALHKNRTRGIFLEQYRWAIERALLPLKEMGLPDYQSLGREKAVWMLAMPNGLGDFCGNGISKSLISRLSRRCIYDFEVEATRALLVIRAHETSTGSLPRSLADLGPEAWPEIPKDPCDGTPLRYNRDRKIIYSIGKDLVDEGGLKKPSDDPNRREMEPTYWLERPGKAGR